METPALRPASTLLLPVSFGYRPGRSTHDALEATRVEANSTAKFSAIDRYAHERLAIFMSVKHGLAGSKHNHMGRFDGPWFRSLGVYRLAGTVRYGTAHAWR